MKEDKRKIFIRTLGCQMNVRDSEVLCGLLSKAGFAFTENSEEANIVIFNTCSVRQHAEDKVWSEVGRVAKHRKDKPLIGIIGCMAQNYKNAAFARSPDVDFVVGPSDIDKTPAIIRKLIASRSALYATKIWETDGQIRPEEIYHTGFYEDREHAYVVISEGCSNYCSYCVVPYVRGALHNRPYQQILQEILQATDNGITTVTLLGQNVNAYQSAAGTQPAVVTFVDLLYKVHELKGIKEFSFITSHPKDASVELFKAMAELPKLKKYLHLPVQSGSDRILTLMNRGYSRKYYLELIEKYRTIVPEGQLTTDIIVGFPTETEKDHEDSLSLVQTAQFNAAYIFKYSPRPYTKAADMYPDDVAKEQKERRHQEILTMQKSISKTKPR